MSATYPEYPHSNFPDGTDSWETFLDVVQSDARLLKQYQQYILDGDIANAQEIYRQIPDANRKFIGALVMNQFADAIMSLESFYGNSGFEAYVESKETEWKTVIDKFSYIGIYNKNTQYQKNNIVLYNVDGQNYLFINIYNGTTPKQIPPTNTTYWRILTIRGEKGEAGSSTTFYFEWSPTTEYKMNNIVAEKSSLYVALQDNTNIRPSSNPNYWQLIFQTSIKHYPVQSEQPTNASIGDFWFRIIS